MTGAVILILSALPVMIWGAKRKSRSGNVAAVCAFPVMLIGAVMIFRSMGPQDFIARDSGYYATQGAMIGSEMKKAGIGGSVELLVLESDFNSPEVAEFCRILEKFGSFETMTVHPLRLGNPAAPRICDRIDVEDFEAVCSAIPEDAVIISLAGVPGNFRKLELFKRKSARRFIAVCPEAMPLGPELAAGRILAAVMPRKDAVFNDRPVSDYLEAFGERYRYLSGKI